MVQGEPEPSSLERGRLLVPVLLARVKGLIRRRDWTRNGGVSGALEKARIGDAGAAMVATDWDDRDEPALEGGGAFIYLRLRRARYGPDQLDRWAARLDPLLAGGSDVFVFFRHDEDGLMALQAITIGDQIFNRHKRSVDFIKRYIFPGSCIPSITAISNAVAGSTDLRLVQLEDITPHYARTLNEWRRRFFANLEKVRKLGYSDTFIRMWEYYLCYCEGGFAERYIGDVQMLFAKPLYRWKDE